MMKHLSFLTISLLTIFLSTSLLAEPPVRKSKSGQQSNASKSDRQSKNTERPPTPIPWADLMGKKITLVGLGQNYKIGAKIECEDFTISVDLPAKSWPTKVYNRTFENLDAVPKKVRVTGKLEQWNDLPVFIASKSRGQQGIPVPDGTDLNEARKRYLLVDVDWDIMPESTALSTRKDLAAQAKNPVK